MYILRGQNVYEEPNCRLTKYKTSLLPHAISSWNKLDNSISSISNFESFKEALCENIFDHRLYHIGSRNEQILMTILRMQCSNLNGHLYSRNIIDNSSCLCGFINEGVFNDIFACPMYDGLRLSL